MTRLLATTAVTLVLLTSASAETIVVQTPFGSARINVPGKRVDVPSIHVDTPAGSFRMFRVPHTPQAVSPEEPGSPSTESVPPQQQRYRPQPGHADSRRLEDLKQQVAGSDPDTRRCIEEKTTPQSTADEIAKSLQDCHKQSMKND
jgi:hypothetical protein